MSLTDRQTEKPNAVITKEHFDYFVQEIINFQIALGLLDWELFFEHEDIEARADITYNIMGRCATIRLAKEWQICQPTLEQLSKAAFHEITHLLTADYQDLITNDTMSKTAKLSQAEIVDHVLIRRLEHSIFKALKEGVLLGQRFYSPAEIDAMTPDQKMDLGRKINAIKRR